MPEVWLHPDCEELSGQTLLEPKKIEQPVFTIGRRASSSVNYPESEPPDLLIFERAPYTLSRQQCQIEINDGEVILRDMGSRAGTKIGDKRLISSKREPKSVVVPKGSHTLILGHRDGPFRFRLDVS